MPDKLTHDKFDERVKAAMQPPGVGRNGQGFAPSIGNLRQAAGRRRPAPPPQLPRGRG